VDSLIGCLTFSLSLTMDDEKTVDPVNVLQSTTRAMETRIVLALVQTRQYPLRELWRQDMLLAYYISHYISWVYPLPITMVPPFGHVDPASFTKEDKEDRSTTDAQILPQPCVEELIVSRC